MMRVLSLLQTLSVLQWVCTFLFMGPGFLLLSFYLLFTPYRWFVLLYGIWYMYDRSTPHRGGRSGGFLKWCRRWTVWKLMASYFPAKLVKTCELDPARNYLVAFHPHGVLSAGAFLHFGTEGTHFSDIFKGITPHLAVLKGHFDFPVYRDYFLNTGCISNTKESIRYALTDEPGHLVCLVVGGALEALDSHPGKYTVHLKNKKGFVKIALQTGASLVPCVSFGETDLFDQVDNPPGSLVRRIQNAMTAVFGFSSPLFSGRAPLVPFRKAIHSVVGEPIHVDKMETPTQEDIDQLHENYVTEVQNLFDAHKKTYASAESKLEIV